MCLPQGRYSIEYKSTVQPFWHWLDVIVNIGIVFTSIFYRNIIKNMALIPSFFRFNQNNKKNLFCLKLARIGMV